MDYIEREAVEKMLENAQIISDGENCGYCTDDISISSIQSADVSPVVHGKWIEKGEDLYCSKCDHIIPDCAGNATVISKTENRFCYFCGAKMDG